MYYINNVGNEESKMDILTVLLEVVVFGTSFALAAFMGWKVTVAGRKEN